MSHPLTGSLLEVSNDPKNVETDGGGSADIARKSGGKMLPWGATWIFLLSLSAIVSSILLMTLRTTRGFFVPVLAAGICILAALFDAWTKRIPNALTYTAALLGLAINLASSGLMMMHADVAARCLGAPGIGQSLLGFGVCAGLAVLGMIAKVGGGDLKLLVALGALLGLADMGAVLIVALSVAVVYAVVNLAILGRLNAFAQFTALKILELIYLRQLTLPEAEPNAPPTARTSVPMAVPLAVGLIIAEVLNIRARLEGIG
jgi:prepilin peptidase CpaA